MEYAGAVWCGGSGRLMYAKQAGWNETYVRMPVGWLCGSLFMRAVWREPLLRAFAVFHEIVSHNHQLALVVLRIGARCSVEHLGIDEVGDPMETCPKLSLCC